MSQIRNSLLFNPNKIERLSKKMQGTIFLESFSLLSGLGFD